MMFQAFRCFSDFMECSGIRVIVAFPFLLAFGLSSCSQKVTETGNASYYSSKFNGRKTASGERFRNSDLTAAHKNLPFGTVVKVINLKNGKSVKVRINDRGPFVPGRILDLSARAAGKIGLVEQGVGKVQVRYKKKRSYQKR
jgi:rare lipoprotein A